MFLRNYSKRAISWMWFDLLMQHGLWCFLLPSQPRLSNFVSSNCWAVPLMHSFVLLSVLDTLAQLSFCRHRLQNTNILYSALSALLLPFCHSSPPTPPFLCSRLHLYFPLLLWIYLFVTEKGQQLLPDSTYQKSCQQFYSEFLLFSAVKNVSQCSKTNLLILIERNGGNNPLWVLLETWSFMLVMDAKSGRMCLCI